MHGMRAAADLWRLYNLRIPVDLRQLVDDLGLEVVPFPFHGRVKEMIIDGVIGIRPGLTRPWFRWYVAHAIGHHLMHVGTSFYLDTWQWVSLAKAERQAEEFAAWLLSGAHAGCRSAGELGIPSQKVSLIWRRSDADAGNA